MSVNKGRRGRKDGFHYISQKELVSILVQVFEQGGVTFEKSSKRSYADRVWGLYKSLLVLAPTLVISSGLPVSIYNVGSVRVSESSSGRRRIKTRYSLASRYLDHYLQRENYVGIFWKLFKNITATVSREDSVLLETGPRLTVGKEEL